MLLSIYIDLCHVEKTEINKKRPGLAHFLKKQSNIVMVWLSWLEKTYICNWAKLVNNRIHENIVAAKKSPTSAFKIFVKISCKTCAIVFGPSPHVPPQQFAGQVSWDRVPENDAATDPLEVDHAAVEVLNQLLFAHLNQFKVKFSYQGLNSQRMLTHVVRGYHYIANEYGDS